MFLSANMHLCKCIFIMAWKLHLLVWITVITTSTAYKYPVQPSQLQSAAYPLDAESPGYSRHGSDCGLSQRSPADEGNMNEKSVERVQDEVRVYQPKVEEPMARRSENGSSKILNSFVKPARRGGQVDRNQIVFPGPTASIGRQFEPEIPESCMASTLCETVTNYPRAQVDELISEIKDLHGLTLERMDTPETPDITQRLGPTEENVELCNFQEKVVYPEGGKAADGKWYTLLNNKENPVQGFRVETCQESESSCSDIAVFVTGYVARCKQKYVLRTAKVVVQNPDTTFTTVEKQIKVPSCCSCVAKANIT